MDVRTAQQATANYRPDRNFYGFSLPPLVKCFSCETEVASLSLSFMTFKTSRAPTL